MNIEYQYTFRLPRNIVWKYLMDEVVLRNSLPGCKSFAERTKGVYEGKLEFSVGPFNDVFSLVIRRHREKQPSSFELKVKGKGTVGEIECHADIILHEFEGASILTCKADGHVTGAIALAGQRALESKAEKGLEDFFQTAEKEIKRTLYHLKRGGR